MVPPSPAPDDHADPAWLARLRSILRLNKGGVIIGLEGAHPACAGPLIELLLEEGAPVRVCFTARELLEAPEDARVVLLHAARDADFLNMARPVVSERRLRVLVWLRPGDRRELSRRARDFLDWMQETVDIPEFLPGYAEQALRRALEERVSVTWERAPLDGLVPGITVLLADVDDANAIAAMRRGPVVVHRPRDTDELARFEAIHRMAGGAFAIVWDEPAVLPVETTRIIAEPLDWEVASEWLVSAAVDEPRIEAARLQLDPMAISKWAGREPPPPTAERDLPRAFVEGRERGAPRFVSGHESTVATRDWWEEVRWIIDPVRPPQDPKLIVRRPAAWPGLASLEDRLRHRAEPEVHVVTGAVGSGVSTELLSLGLQLQDERCVVMLDVWAHFMEKVRDVTAIEHLRPWELVALLGVAAIRVGRDRWGVGWRREPFALTSASSYIDPYFGRFVGGLVGATSTSDVKLKVANDDYWAKEAYGRPYAHARDADSALLHVDRYRLRKLTSAVWNIVKELRVTTGREIVFLVDGLEHLSKPQLLDALDRLEDSLGGVLHADVVLTAPLTSSPRWRHAQTVSYIDDIPVVDVHEPTRRGPGIEFLRDVLERRFACISSERPQIPDDVLERLCWGSGGRPGECLRLVLELAALAMEEPFGELHDLAEQVLRDRRHELAQITRQGHELLTSLLRGYVEEPADSGTARDLQVRGLFRRYPTPEGGHRVLPHPLLIEGLIRS